MNRTCKRTKGELTEYIFIIKSGRRPIFSIDCNRSIRYIGKHKKGMSHMEQDERKKISLRTFFANMCIKYIRITKYICIIE